ncbi:hypothetical protein KUL113_04170 [Tenacibaculum sp. KUL113]|nr:hypothetical protein KUL113_04170 [Tenacibaculum sp. KUL113]
MPEFKPTEMRVIPALLKSNLDFISKSLKNPVDQDEHIMEYGILKMQQKIQTLNSKELETFLAESKDNIATLRMVLDAAEKEIATLVDEG